MKALVKIVLATFPAGVMTAIVWLWVNSFGKQNGIGFLDKQSWPLNDMYSCSGIAITLAIFSINVFERSVARRRQQLEAAGAMLGLRFRETVTKEQLNIEGRLPLLDDWNEGRNLLEGSFDGISIRIFDFASATRSKPLDNTSTADRDLQTVILLPFSNHDGVTFSVRRQGSVLSLSRLLGFEGLSFEATEILTEDEQEQLRRFNKNYLVIHLDDSTSASKHIARRSTAEPQDEQAIAQQIGFPLLKSLIGGRGWSFDACHSHVVFWVHNKRFKPSQVPQVINESLQLLRELSLNQQVGPPLRLTGHSNVLESFSFKKFAPVILSGFLGMALSFALFVPIFFKFADKAPWLVFVWPLFGMAVSLLSVVVGSRIARRKR